MFDPKRANVVNGAVVPQPANKSRFILAKTCLAEVSTPHPEDPEPEDCDEVEYLEDAVEMLLDEPVESEVKPKITFMQRLKNLFTFK